MLSPRQRLILPERINRKQKGCPDYYDEISKNKKNRHYCCFDFTAYLLQCTVFPFLEIAGIKPNLMIIVTASVGFMRGTREGMFTGFASGLLIDIQFGDMIGFYAVIYLLIGYINGIFHQTYYDEDIKFPLFQHAI